MKKYYSSRKKESRDESPFLSAQKYANRQREKKNIFKGNIFFFFFEVFEEERGGEQE
jgi:hypothetical protein